jgi:hypothetical protein
MPPSINWATKVISVPKTDLTLVSPGVYEHDLDAFRLQLKDIEDSQEGIVFPDTHRHNTTVVLSGVTYARVLEIINGYTVTYEDGQYAVNLVGANNNIPDVMNVNQVSVRASNSAGMIVVDGGGGGTGATPAELWNSFDLEAGLTPAQAMRLILSAVQGKLSIDGSGVVRTRDIADTKNRLVVPTDEAGQRLSVTRDAS